MRLPFPLKAAADLLACFASSARSQDREATSSSPVAAPASAEAAAPEAPAGSPSGAVTVYRQILPDGRVVYTDKPQKGTKIDQAITVEPPIKGNTWATETGQIGRAHV